MVDLGGVGSRSTFFSWHQLVGTKLCRLRSKVDLGRVGSGLWSGRVDSRVGSMVGSCRWSGRVERVDGRPSYLKGYTLSRKYLLFKILQICVGSGRWST